ncbi:hypothetical protein [Clostridium sp. 1001271B_151109_B4]|uniref:hypothetical protein n=1 Tax=Clostridium sp. 1001271B_151109_B4 TaxID=2787148 RepID=UPI0018A910B9|nr:hypothetical protein [Clostridium sp. 1001271B_151109_B4]
MQNTTADYKLEINKPSRSFECKITIGNNIYTNEDLVNLTLEYSQPQEGFAIGNTISQSLDLTLLNRGDIIYSTSQIKVEIGLKIDSTIEYILMGIFNIDDIEKTDYTTKITAYDNMIKFETDYFSELGDKPTLKQVVNELSSKTGVEFEGSLPDYNVSKLEGFTCREVLSYVASICGGNAVITRDGKFTIKSLSEVEKSIDGNNYFDYTREEVKYKVGQISCQVDENNILSKGSTGTDSMELGFENPWVTETILTEIYNKLKSVEYLGYSMKWQGDLSLDPYDIITVTDIKNVVRKIPILSQKLSYTGGLTSEIGAKGETKNKNSFSSSGSTTNKVNRAVIEQAIIKEALIEKANIKDVEAVSIRTQTLEAKTAKIEEAIIDVAHISDLNAINANIQNLIAADATINNALINKADITELNAVKGTINVLESDTANIKNLLAGNISGESGQLIHLTASNVVIADAVIKDLIASNISVQDLKASTISTNKFTIASTDGGLSIVGPTMQFKDRNNKVRIQIGQDTQGNFNFILRGADGTTTLIDHTGIKEKAIADNLIKGNMVATDAIGEKQINYSSLITGLNKDTNTQLIKASKVAIDLAGQTLDVAFNSLKTNVDSKETRNLFIEKNTVDGYYNDTDFIDSSSYRTSDYIEVNEGKIYTLCKFAADGYHRIVVFDKDKNRLGARLVETDRVLKYTIPSSVKYIRVSIENTNKYKIEKGDNPNPVWTAAPEDVDSSIESVKQITESNSITINVMQGQIATAINNTQIVKDGQTILLKDDYNRTVATVNSINSTIGTHTTKLNELTGSISSVDTKINSVQRDLEGTKSTVSSHTSQINGLNSTVSTQGSSINQLKNEISLKVEQTDINNAVTSLKIGGDNVIRNGNFTYSMSDWSVHDMSSGGTSKSVAVENGGGDWKPDNKKVLVIRGTNTTNRYGVISSTIKLIPKTKYTISGYCAGHRVNKIQVNVRDRQGSDANIHTIDINPVSGGSTLDKWCRFETTFTTTSNTDFALNLYSVNFADNGYVWFCDVQIQQGTKASAWIPCSADIDNSISNVQTQVTTTSNKVATIETNLNSITQRISSTESTVSTHTSQLTTVDSRINTAKNSAISTAASDATSKANSAQTNAVNSAKSYTDGQITTVNQTITNKVAEIKATTDSISQKVSATESKITTINGNISGLTNRVSTAESKLTATSLTTTISSAISGGTSSISTTQFVMDKSGLTIKNGALTIQNKAGTTVLNSDTNGNLKITGEIRSQYNQQWVALNSGGLTFQDSQRNEQMLRVGLAYFTANRDMNGVEFAMPQYSDFIRFSHIAKADLNNGWSSADTTYNFFELWSGTQTFGGSTRNKGMTVNSPLYINKGIKLYSGTNHLSEIGGAVSWNNGTGTVTNMLGLYGDNGAILGYKSGEDLKARFLVTEGSHPGTGDNIISWGNYNFNGYTFHNAKIVATSLSVSGSKNCLQETKNYGSRLINAYETAEYYFGDLGFGKINEYGECLLYIDDIFLECVNTNAQYHVFTQVYNGSIKTIERYKTYVVIKGEPGTNFSWQLMGKRIGYENNRLETQEIEIQGENKIELFGDEDFKVRTSENALMSALTFELEDLLLMEE